MYWASSVERRIWESCSRVSAENGTMRRKRPISSGRNP